MSFGSMGPGARARVRFGRRVPVRSDDGEAAGTCYRRQMSIAESITHFVAMGGGDWFSLKASLEHRAGVNDDGLHAIFGVVLQLALAAIFRIPVTRLTPWLALLGLELVNEWNDQLLATGTRDLLSSESMKDILLTMFLPTLLLLVARRYPVMFRHET